jgi:hypothetical protein
MPAMSQLEHCVFSPASAAHSFAGVPDGGPEKVINFEHRYAFTLKPDSGEVGFAITPCPLGGFAHGTGTVMATIANINGTTGIVDSFAPVNITGNPARSYHTFPYQEFWTGIGARAGSVAQNGGLQIQKFRVVASKANVSYTGSTFTDSGTVAVGRQNIGVSKIVYPPASTVTIRPWNENIQYLSSSPPTTFEGVSILPNAQVSAARSSFELNNPPMDFGWQPWVYSAPTATDDALGDPATFGLTHFAQSAFQITPTVLGNYAGIPGLGHAPCTFVQYQGLDSSTTITVLVTTCVEYTVSFNSVAGRMAKPGPPVDDIAIQNVKDIGRSMPPSLPSSGGSGFGSMLDWYTDTMKSIIGTTWQTGAKMIPFAGDILNGLQSLRIGGQSRRAIGGGGYNPRAITW